MALETIEALIRSQVGPMTPLADGSFLDRLRASKTGDMLVASAHGALYEAASRGRLFMACNQAAVTFGTGLTATAVTFTLYNPFGSGVNLALLHTGVTMITSTTAGSLVYAANTVPSAAAPANNTELIVRNAKLSGGPGLAKVFSVTTLPAAPVAVRTLASGFTTNANASIHDYVNGGLVLDPGCCLTVQGITIVGTGLIDMLWEEIPLNQ